MDIVRIVIAEDVEFWQYNNTRYMPVTVDVTLKLSYSYNSPEKLNHDYCETCSFKSRSTAAKAANVQDPWIAP